VEVGGSLEGRSVDGRRQAGNKRRVEDMMRQKKEIRTEKDGGGRRETCETQEGDVIIITQSHDIQSI
jgi:hypothetical protein